MQLWLKCNLPPATFVFTPLLRGSTFSDMNESIDYGWKEEARAGNKRFSQVTELPFTSYSLSGRYCPLYHQMSTDSALKAIADLQMPLDMIDGEGNFLGQVKIKKLSFKKTRWVDGVPLVVDFTAEIDEYAN